jgi:hypothetical protein
MKDGLPTIALLCLNSSNKVPRITNVINPKNKPNIGWFLVLGSDFA